MHQRFLVNLAKLLGGNQIINKMEKPWNWTEVEIVQAKELANANEWDKLSDWLEVQNETAPGANCIGLGISHAKLLRSELNICNHWISSLAKEKADKHPTQRSKP